MVIKPGKPSIRVSHPEVAAQLHPTKNNGLTAEQIVAGSRKKYWWVCPEGPDHEWDAFVSNRTLNGNGCPCCAGKQVSVTNSLTNYTDVAAQLHPTKNEGVTPDQIIAGSNKKYWWKCPEGPDHEWLTTPGSRTGVETFFEIGKAERLLRLQKSGQTHQRPHGPTGARRLPRTGELESYM